MNIPYLSRILCLLPVFFLPADPSPAQEPPMPLLGGMKARSIGPAGMSGRVTAIDALHSNPDVIFVGTASGGLWKSVSGGIAWEPVFDKEKVASIGAVAIDQSNPDVIWAGTGEGNPRNSLTAGYGIYKSLDGGRTWKLMGLEKTRHIHRVIIHPRNPDIVYVAAIGSPWGPHPERGVYRTKDGGMTWERILFANEVTGCADLVMDPVNPNKLFAALWEHRRRPWDFQSGGKGSGLYVTFDGGATWQQRTDKDGLPEGELGRIGLAIARSNPQVVYALIESKKNALYRSDDGGFKWNKAGDKDIGNRPFYYSEIHVDPSNENRIYSLYSMVNRSEDGGKTFKTIIPYSGVHPDHHAWWIHPGDAGFIIEGNDGGLNISRDRAKNWRFVGNLPLAQYYHIRVDNEAPYNVYGGMQDNGSWRGPAYVWRHGGIRNSYWEEVMFGDGFDVMPDPTDARYGYAMSQGGYLGRYDLVTGDNWLVRPAHPDGKELRFNWNAAIAQDPFSPSAIYYGSQYVHKSTDKGASWEIISPDLTTNDPEKQKQKDSGGLTYDVTGAENHTTIIAIGPSPVQQGVLWAGTDDGNIQLTKDGGKTWANLTANLKGLPKGCWVAQIRASAHSAAEAFAVVNNYRQNDWEPYVYHTADFGVSWRRITPAGSVWGYALSIVQDPVEPNLLFLGTEFGLYVSFRNGASWTKWTHGYPTVSTMDLAIHPVEHDLVIGTFGRAAYVLDDIRPLRAIAAQGARLLEKPLHVFTPPDAVLAVYGQASGMRFPADGEFSGANRPYGAIITYSVGKLIEKKKDRDKGEKDKTNGEEAGGKNSSDSVKIEVFDPSGALIRTLRHKPDTAGLNRAVWRLDRKGERRPDSPKPKAGAAEPGGISVLPGRYRIRLTYGDAADSTEVTVKADPRTDVADRDMIDYQLLRIRFGEKMERLTTAADRLREALETIEKIKTAVGNQENMPDSVKKSLRKDCAAVKDTINALLEALWGKKEVQGIYRDPEVLSSKIGLARSYFGDFPLRSDPNRLLLLRQTEAEMKAGVERINAFFAGTWSLFREKLPALDFSPFKDYEPVKWD